MIEYAIGGYLVWVLMGALIYAAVTSRISHAGEPKEPLFTGKKAIIASILWPITLSAIIVVSVCMVFLSPVVFVVRGLLKN